MGLFSWIILGLLAGFLARRLLPGIASGGLLTTLVLGVVGALVGGYLGTLIGFGEVAGLDPVSLLLAVFGAVLVLAGYKLIRRI